jgi:hypothetical protein
VPNPPRLSLFLSDIADDARIFAALERVARVMTRHGVKPPDTFQSPAAVFEELAGFIEELDARLGPGEEPTSRSHGYEQ